MLNIRDKPFLEKRSCRNPSEGVEKQRPKHEGQIGFRVPKDLRERLDRVHARHLTSDAGVFRALAEAFCEEAEKQQRVALPLKIQFTVANLDDYVDRRALNESPPGISSTPRKNHPAAGRKLG